MNLLALIVVLAWLHQSELSNKDQRTVSLLQWMNSYQDHTTLLCKGFIVDSKVFALPFIIFKVLLYFNMLETEHCTFF
jgi:hypothetical protein